MSPKKADLAQVGRPVSIMILVILSYIGIGISVITSIWRYFNLKATASKGIVSSTRFREGLDLFSNSTKWVPLITLVSILAAMFCLWGVILIWKLKKTGYIFYVTGEAAPIIVTCLLTGFGSLFTSIDVASVSILSVVFILFYSLNLKHLSW
jgi:hypothetical protein